MLKFCTQIIAIGILAINPLSAQAAEKITIAYNVLEFSVPVALLERFANQGEIDPALREYTRYLNQPQIEQLRQVLTQKIALSAVDVSQLSNTSFGEKALSFLGDIIQTGLRQVKTPTFMVAGSKDELAPPLLEQVCPFTWLNHPHKYLAMIQGATHNYATPKSPQNRLFTLLGSIQMDSTPAREYLKSMSLAFFKTHIQRQSAQTLLEPTPKQSALALHLIRNLSADQIKRSINITCPGATDSQSPERN